MPSIFNASTYTLTSETPTSDIRGQVAVRRDVVSPQ